VGQVCAGGSNADGSRLADSSSVSRPMSARRQLAQIRNGTGRPCGPSMTSTLDIGWRGRSPHNSQASVRASGRLRWLAEGSPLASSGTTRHCGPATGIRATRPSTVSNVEPARPATLGLATSAPSRPRPPGQQHPSVGRRETEVSSIFRVTRPRAGCRVGGILSDSAHDRASGSVAETRATGVETAHRTGCVRGGLTGAAASQISTCR
jgi:hypothetical protein